VPSNRYGGQRIGLPTCRKCGQPSVLVVCRRCHDCAFTKRVGYGNGSGDDRQELRECPTCHRIEAFDA